MKFNPFRRRRVEADLDKDQVTVAAPAIMISGDRIITLVLDGSTHTIGEGHANHKEILVAISNEDWSSLPDLLDVQAAVARFTEGTEVVVDEYGEVTYRGEAVHNLIATRITQFFREGLPFKPLVLFLENLMANPSRRAVDELYSFLENEGMPITEDGCFIGYKGVGGNLRDKYTGEFDNSPGQVLSMSRNLVDDDARRSCSNGFHVGSHRYASSWGEVTLLVKVNPANCVSVPYAEAEKLRVCEYEVLAVCERLLTEPLYAALALGYDEDEDEWDECPENEH